MATKTAGDTSAARQSKFDPPDIRATFLEHVENGETLTEAARQIGCSLTIIRRARATDPTFAAQLTEAERIGFSARESGKKFTTEVRGLYLTKLREGKRRGAAAREVGLDPSSVRAYAARHEDFRQERRVAEAEADELVEDAMFVAATKDRNQRAIETWLFNRKPDKWRDKRFVGIVGGRADDPTPSVEVTVTDKSESTERIGRAIEQGGALAASLGAVLGAVLAHEEAEA